MRSRWIPVCAVGLVACVLLIGVAPAARADCCMCQNSGVPCPEAAPVCFTNQTSCASQCLCSNGSSQNGGSNFTCGEGPFAACGVIDGTPVGSPAATATVTATVTATATATVTATAVPTLVPNGGSCTAAGQCASGICRNGICVQDATAPAGSPLSIVLVAVALLLAGFWSARTLGRR